MQGRHKIVHQIQGRYKITRSRDVVHSAIILGIGKFTTDKTYSRTKSKLHWTYNPKQQQMMK